MRPPYLPSHAGTTAPFQDGMALHFEIWSHNAPPKLHGIRGPNQERNLP
jgi:hypothetical protein